MKKPLLLPFILLILTGCFSTIKPSKQIDDNQKVIAKEEKKVDNTLVEIEKNDKGKRIQTSGLSVGIQHSLNQVTNAPVQVDTALKLNERVISIVGSPHIDETKRIKATVDLLNSALVEERRKGEEMLAQRDDIINKLQKEKSELNQKYDDQLWQLTDKAKFWGLKKFVISALTTIIVFVVVFVILRLLATVHPAAAAAFSIFNMLGSMFVSIIKALTPKAFELSNLISKDKVEEFKSPLVKIVDVIQELKEKQKEFPDRVYPVTEALKRFDKEMDSKEKDLIDDILKEQKWIK